MSKRRRRDDGRYADDGSKTEETAVPAGGGRNGSNTENPPGRGRGARTESLALRSILGDDDGDGEGDVLVRSFFRETWQVEPRLYRRRRDRRQQDGGRETRTPCPALDGVLGMGWDGVAALLHRSRDRFDALDRGEEEKEEGWFSFSSAAAAAGPVPGAPSRPAPPAASAPPSPPDPPLFFRNQEPIQPPDMESLYSNNPLAAYLDGCSVVLNHADLISPDLAALCLDLQRSFPHVYVNAYLTPPGGQAVPPHADDRDVLVVQLAGRKLWKVYSQVPIPNPYPTEQVGKAGLPVPDRVLRSPTVVESALEVGDVLYMPRGYVHEAWTDGDGPSFHATVAIATHDWTVAGNISEMVGTLLRSVPDLRTAVDRDVGAEEVDADAAVRYREQVDRALRMIGERVTADAVAANLRAKYDRQNDLSAGIRRALIREEEGGGCRTALASPTEVVGPIASATVRAGTVVRASTDEERGSVRPPSSSGSDRGLTVRDETCQALMSVLQRLKADRTTEVKVLDLRSLLDADVGGSKANGKVDGGIVCDDLTLLCFARCCVELGAMAVVP